jgi:predicted Zn finger-like uncharacterized protein
MMLTRCPGCSTAFRVTPEQLKARAGKVRCGHCSAVFNALEMLEDAPPAVEAVEAASPPPEAAPPASVETPQPELFVENSPPATIESAPGEEAANNESVDILLEGIGSNAETPPSRRRLLAWSLAVLVVLGIFVVQAAYVFRAELAQAEPDLRPLLLDMCSVLDCDIPLPRKPDLVGIEASDLHPDPQQKPLLVLAATLKNRAPFAQDYPHLELTLTDVRDQPVLRKVLSPVEYLAQGTNAREGFAANGDLTVSLWLDTGEVVASGYRLYLFYP